MTLLYFISIAEFKTTRTEPMLCTNAPINILVNNAGFGTHRDFSDDTLENKINMVGVHIIAAIKLIQAVLPKMIEKRK